MKKIQTPELLRRAEVRPQSLDKKNRTVEVVFSTGARVMRRPFFDEPYWEELSLDPAHLRLDRLNNGAPFLRVHDDWTLESVLGVVESAATDGSVGTAVIRFSERPDVEPGFNDITSGILRHVSVGYKVWHYDEMPKAEDGIRVLRATDWEPVELSAVPVGADDGAVVRSGGSVNECVINFMEEIMTKKKRQDEAPAQKPVVAEEAGAEEETVEDPAEVEAGAEESEKEKVDDSERKAVLDERTRIAVIRTTVRAAKLEESIADDFVTNGAPLDEVRAKVIDILADRDRQSNTRTARMEVVDMEEKKTRRDAVAAAIMHRADPNRELPEVAREYRGMNLMDMAREAVEKAGGKTRGLSRREIAVAALNLDRNLARMHSVSDFPEILSTAVNRTLRDAYQLAPRTFVPWCRKSTAPDFREVARTQLSEMSKFQKVNAGGEYKHLSFGDSAEKYSLAKSGGIVAVTWEAIINDDLDAFSRIPFALAEEAAASESDVVYGILSGNPNMADSVALFDASTHKNYTTSSGTAISDTSLGVARALMRKQKGPKGRQLNITPDFLIVGPDREVLANKYTSASFVAAKASDITPNFFSALQVIVEPRISGNAWYLAAKPMRIDTIEYAYLEGEEGLFTEERVGFEVDGIEIKARHVFAAKAIDYRGLYMNDGA